MTARTKKTTETPTICLLGAPRIDLSGEPVALPRRKTRSLLYFLAAAPGDHGRDELVDLLWPNLDPAKGRRQLSDALSDLRRTLGAEAIVSDTETVALIGISCDAIEFATAVDEAGRRQGSQRETTLSATLDLYGGEFLAGIRIEGSEAFDEWVQEQRLNLSVAALGAFARLGALRLDRGDAPGAIEVTQRGLDLDNLREDLWRVLIEARSAMGDRAGALAEYSRCAKTLERELGVRPEAETEALRRQISAEPGTPGAGATESTAAKAKPPLPFSLRLPGSSPALVGRERQLGALLRAWDTARKGAGGLAAIDGEPGIGKSRLAAEFAARVASSGATVLAARCPDLSDPPPYGPIEEAIRQVLPSMPTGAFSKLGHEWLPWIGRLLPELGLSVDAPTPVSPEEEKARLSEAAARVIDVIAGDRPLLLIVEDIHWAHPATILLMHSVARRRRPVLVLTTMRDTEPQTEGTRTMARTLTDLAKDALGTTVSLGPLSIDDTTVLVNQAIESAGATTKASATAVAKLAEGQPLFALELTRTVLESSGDPDLPVSLTNAIGARVERASEFARRILELAAVFGRPVTLQLLGRAAGVDPSYDPLISAGDELLARRLLREDESGRLTFAHGLIHAATYRSLSASRRRALHARAASALEPGTELPPGVRSEALARHYRLAGDLPRAAEHLIAAADRANSLGETSTADERARAASQLLLRLGKDREAAEALERAAGYLIQGCEIFGSGERFREALAIWEEIPGSEDALGRVNIRLAELCTRWGWSRLDHDEIRRHVEIAIQYVESSPELISGEDRARAYAARSLLGTLVTGDHLSALEDAADALRAADGYPHAWLVAKDAECAALLKLGRLDEGLQSTLDKVPVATGISDYFELGDAYAMAYLFCSQRGDVAAAEKYARLGLEADKRSKLGFRILLSSTHVADTLVDQGRFEEAEQLLGQHPGDPALDEYAAATFARRDLLMAEICAGRGDLRAARQFLDAGERIEQLVRNDPLKTKRCLPRARETVRQAEAKEKVAAHQH